MPAADGPSEWLAIRVLPPPPPSVFDSAQVVAFYGHPGIPGMGALGVYGPERLVEEVTRVATLYDALNGDRDVIPALHLITSIAQPRPGADGKYLEFISHEKLAIYVELAEEHGLLLILDEQIGWSDPLTDVQRLEWALKKPFVHLALDPEWSTRSYGVAPGMMIGTLGAPEVNAVQQYLADLVRRYNLPPKVLVLHQFRSEMLTDTDSYRAYPEVEISIDMDGFGGPWPKLANYDTFALAEYSERPAIKLFYDWDVPLMDPEQIQGLDSPPDLIIYQ